MNPDSFLRSDYSNLHDGINATHLAGALLNEALDHTKGQRISCVFHTTGIVQRPIWHHTQHFFYNHSHRSTVPIKTTLKMSAKFTAMIKTVQKAVRSPQETYMLLECEETGSEERCWWEWWWTETLCSAFQSVRDVCYSSAGPYIVSDKISCTCIVELQIRCML